MSKKNGVKSIATIALLATSLFGFTAFADAADSTTSTTPAAPSATDMAQMQTQMKQETSDFISKLATNLGIDETTLTTDLNTTITEILTEEVSAGTITQDQADKIAAQGFTYNCGGGPGGQGAPSGTPPTTTTATSTSGS